jgi:organic radical activating enzyme
MAGFVFGKKWDETYQEYRDRSINSISPSFCGAKWYNATIWLNMGQTTSCHHPQPHKIPLRELERSPKALHNTQYKKLVRKEMLEGIRPKECEYCWKIEDLGADKVSDRVYKSVIYSDEELVNAQKNYSWNKDVDLKTLEISFDANCNFACSYCNASFSTTWQSDIKTNGAYQNLVTDGGGAFQHAGDDAMIYGKDQLENPYLEAFWKWWEGDLQNSLRELRVTGGEPTMSKGFWKLMDWWKENKKCDVNFAVNSNLGQSKMLVDRLINSTHNFKHFSLYTSCESVGAHAEYIRDGLKWEVWKENAERIIVDGNLKTFNVMMTINALCLFSITEFLDFTHELRKKYENKTEVLVTLNILRFPSFQSATTLPEHIKLERAQHLQNWAENLIKENKETNLHTEASLWGLVNQVYRLCEYLREVTQGHRFASDLESREKDFKSFYTQYDNRRGKNFVETFPELSEWYTSINATELNEMVQIQKAADNGVYNKEYMEKAMADSVVNDALENEILEYLEPKKLI